MKIPDLKLINFDNYNDKCRICFTAFKKSEKKINITQRTKGSFENYAGLEVKN